MSEWRAVWEVVVLGTADKAFDVLRQNAAIGWMMLTMVEGIARAEGGVGAMLLNQSKHFHLAEVFAHPARDPLCRDLPGLRHRPAQAGGLPVRAT